MREYEMIKDMCPEYGTMCDKCNANGICSVEYTAKRLINKNYRRIANDEMVIKKSEYEVLKKATPIIKVDIREQFLKECEYEMQKLEQKTKQETIREILKELNDEGYKIYKQQGNTFDAGNFNWLIAHTMQKHDIKSE
jgi:hypothetical protein